MTDCEQFGINTRFRQLCEGTAELPLRKINGFRKQYGLPPLRSETTTPTISSQSGTFSIKLLENPTEDVKEAVKCCGSSKSSKITEKSQGVKLVGEGPGTSLIQIFKQHGAPVCSACYVLAAQMNSWGKQGCKDRIAEIVTDILPRALSWERAKLGIIAKLLPTGITTLGVRTLVELAIQQSK